MKHTIRLCTWNVQYGLQLPLILEAMTRLPEFEGLDLMALQEASVHNGQEDSATIAALLGTDYHCFQVTADFIAGREQANAVVWNSQFARLVRKDVVRLPHAHESRLSRRERAFIRALPDQERISVMVEGMIGEMSIRMYSAHLDVLGFAHKRAQFSRVLADSRSRPPVDLTIIAGDLNTFRVRSRPSWKELSAAAEAEGFRDLTGEVVWTHRPFPRLRLRQKLDSILVKYSGPLGSRAWALDIPGSDHIPVFADIML